MTLQAPEVHLRTRLEGPVPKQLVAFLEDPSRSGGPALLPKRNTRVAKKDYRPIDQDAVPSRITHPLVKLILDIDVHDLAENALLLDRLGSVSRRLDTVRLSRLPSSYDSTKYDLELDLGALGLHDVCFDISLSAEEFALADLLVGPPKQLARSSAIYKWLSIRYSPNGPRRTLSLVSQLDWYDIKPRSENLSTDHDARTLAQLLSTKDPTLEPWSFQDFYNSVHTPSRTGLSAERAAELKVEGIACRLYPFQRRTICWLLEREGVDQDLNPINSLEFNVKHPFDQISGLDGTAPFVCYKTSQITTDEVHLEDLTLRCAGGLLAEEMGLGKTVEILSLVNLHTRGNSPNQHEADPELTASKATIIVSPESIQNQWKSEIEMHSPHLQVLIYEGMKSRDTDDASEEKEMIEDLSQSDVVLISYNVLSKEIHYTGEEPDRKMRHARRYRKPKSPLVQIDWWRCILDEAQMIEGGLNQAAQTAHQIPRRFSWAVSGTPMKRDATDLRHMIEFLRVSAINYPSWWSWRLLTGGPGVIPYKPVLDQVFSNIAIRHTKEQIKDELVLPPQKRFIMTMPFTAIEEQRYADMFQEMCEDCELDLEGAPLQGDWNPTEDDTIQKMRSWLARLRQTVLHPEVGERNRRALGRSEGPLRTVADVLKVMTTQNETAIRVEERALLSSKLRRGQILEHVRQPKEALHLWMEVLAEAQASVDECRRELTIALSKESKSEHIKEEDVQYEGEAKDEDMSFSNIWRNRLRSALEVLHTATFFVANAYYQIKSNEDLTKADSDAFKDLEKQETQTYEQAKQIRRELLSETQAKASVFMKTIQSRAAAVIPACTDVSQIGGFESRHILEKTDDIYDIMNKQKEKIDAWREAIKKALLTALIDQEDEDLQGDEYETSTKHQDEVYVYIEVLRALIADRHDLLTGQSNALIEIEMRRNMEAAKREEGHSPPLMIKLLEERLAIKPKTFHSSFRNVISELRSLRTTLETASASNKRAVSEREIARITLVELQESIDKQSQAQTELEKELELFMSASNARLDFYRQLQSISDSVAPYEKQFDDDERERTLTQALSTEQKLHEKLQKLRSRGRYLLHLNSENNSQAEPKNCIICREAIEIGVLTSCGHQFCKECLRLWWNAHKSCPVCKKSLSRDEFHPISYKPQIYSVQEEGGSGLTDEETDITESSREEGAIYSGINSTTLAKIQHIDLPGSYGTKIDTLARHLLYLRQADPGAKSIIFSQFRDFLDILGRAFKRFRISFASVDEKGRLQQRKTSKRSRQDLQSHERQRDSGIERFIKDPGVECFFLHARAQATGLNLVNATHVFLCEPLINTALELQAIARVHRIGQHQATSVYMYIVDGTVERAIYDISVRRRLEHAGQVAAKAAPPSKKPNGTVPTSDTKQQKDASAASRDEEDAALEAANREELQKASLRHMLARGAKSGEYVPEDDLWDCLFGVKSVARPSDEARRAVSGFLAGNAAEQRQMAERPFPGC